MAFRFRRRVKLFPGVHLNVSGSGIGMSVGPRGATVSVGSRGTYSNLSIPGTGLYVRQKLSSGDGRKVATPSDQASAKATQMQTRISLADDGTLQFKDMNGDPLREEHERVAKEQNRDNLREWMQEQANDINSALEKIVNIHLLTPRPDKPLNIEPIPFNQSKPEQPEQEKVGVIRGLFSPGKRKRTKEENQQRLAAYHKACELWNKLRKKHEQTELRRVEEVKRDIRSDVDVMDQFLSDSLSEIDWPRETLVSFQVEPGGNDVLLDVDLPEIEDMPTQQANVQQRLWRVTLKEVSAKQNRLNYARHVHSIGFRLIGEVFALLPSSQNVTVSGYSQRPDAKTGNTVDDYLFSVRASREAWQHINFDRLDQVDTEQALAAFELRRNMTKTGVFKPIEPL